MTIKYLDGKRINTSPTSATSVQGYSQLNAGTNGWNIADGALDGERLSLQIVSGSSIIADPIKEIKMKLNKNSSPYSTFYVRVRDSSDNILAEASKVASTISSSLTEYTFTLNTGVILAQGDRVNAEYTGSNSDGSVTCGVNNATEPSTVNCQKYDGSSYSDIDRTPDWQFDSNPSTTISIPQSKPTNVQEWSRTGKQYPSMYESFSSLNTVKKQHFVEWFSGKSIPSYWNLENAVGSATSGMNNEIDGGMYLSATTAANSAHIFNFNGKRQYSHIGSVVNSVMRFNQTGTTTHYAWVGLSYTSNSNASQAGRQRDSTHFLLRNYDNANGALTDTDIVLDSDWHTYKIENKITQTELSMNGALKVTNTSHRPSKAMQPEIFAQSIYSAAGNMKIDCRFYEAYNT